VDSIWIGALVPDARFRLAFRASNPPTRAQAVDELTELLTRLIRRGDRILLGFDFPFGYPAGTADALKLKDDAPAWTRMRDFLLKEMKDKPDNANNRFALAARMNRLMSDGPFPFWGCSKRDVLTTLTMKKSREHRPDDVAEFRQAELAALKSKLGRPQPVWKIAYAGAVGGQTLTGLPAVHKLRAQFEGMRLWPFELGLEAPTPETFDGVDIVACEVYPSMRPQSPKPGEIKDETQVRILAEWFAELDESDRLGSLFEPDHGLPEAVKHEISTEEGWILGI
ncbi:MAG: cobalamin biosynthesis protein CbiG, partial [Pseudomonadota bacterium]